METTTPKDNVSEELAQHGDAFYAVVTFVLTLFPSIAFAIFPGGEMQGKTEDFFFVYIATLPLSVAFTAIFLMLGRQWFDTDQERLIAAVAILTGSAILGWGFGSAQDLQFFEGMHGPPIAWIVALVGYILMTYAILYGVPLFLAGIAAAGWAAYYLHRRLPREL
jgi:hypothetical protein